MDPESNPYFDPKMGINMTKIMRPKRMNFQFVEEGKWSRDAEHMKLKVFIHVYLTPFDHVTNLCTNLLLNFFLTLYTE